MQKTESHVFTGMQSDLAYSRQKSDSLIYAKNIRISAKDSGKLLSITNEKGPLKLEGSISGTILGYCTVGTYVIVFTTEGNNTDHIYRIDLSPDPPVIVDLCKGMSLGFSADCPIEAFGDYENDTVQKVYWTDGKNPPRMANITKTDYTWEGAFDCNPELSLKETVYIRKELGTSGSFAPGVIQYALTYFNKHGQESNIFYTSPLLYTSHFDRGGSPEDKVSNSFRVIVQQPDNQHFDYMRIYSIHRTSLDATPVVKRVQDVYIKDYNNNSSDITIIGGEKEEVNATDIGNKAPILMYNETQYVNTASLRYIEASMLGSSNYCGWYLIKKSTYPSLQVIIPGTENWLTWGPDTDNDSCIIVSETGNTDSSLGNGYIVASVSSWNSNDPTNGGLDENNLIPMYSVKGENITIIKSGISFIDTGHEGDDIDPSELLYKGGESIVAGTIAQKDGTLFLGNIEISRKSIMDESLEDITITQSTRTFYPTVVSSENYTYANQLTSYSTTGKYQSVPCGGFKRGDYYRCGVQFQFKNGKWSEPVYVDDIMITNSWSIDENTQAITAPTLQGSLVSGVSTTLYNKGYRKARAVVVFPEVQDRRIVCQGVTCPTLYTAEHRVEDKDLYAQSSWFFRPYYNSNVLNTNGTASPNTESYINIGTGTSYDVLVDVLSDSQFNSIDQIRLLEVQGAYAEKEKFKIDTDFVGIYSPDFVFDDSYSSVDFSDLKWKVVGKAVFDHTISDIDIQTDSPVMDSIGNGFIHKSFYEKGSSGIISGPFYDDVVVDDNDEKFRAFPGEVSSAKWMVYLWHRNGSLNNDTNRPTGAGTRSAQLKMKCISNARFANTVFSSDVNENYFDIEPKLFSSDQASILRLGEYMYKGNIDTMVMPSLKMPNYFCFGKDSSTTDITKSVITSFESQGYWKTAGEITSNLDLNKGGLYSYADKVWNRRNSDITMGNQQLGLIMQKEGVRIKYKSCPHLVAGVSKDALLLNDTSKESVLPVIELIKSNIKEVMFGGKSSDALKAAQWIPCGEPVSIEKDKETVFKYEYGDTYFQRWDCLKTYPFTLEDQNQVVEIGSFMLETRVNIDGRYDRNRGQINNTVMTPTNFNLYNPVYSQKNNFFSYRILDEDYYKNNKFSNQITWTSEKSPGGDTDAWTNITLASTYNMDGSKGQIQALKVYNDHLYCFQDNCVSIVSFNARVQIPTSDGVPIEITNNYKVDGCKTISDGLGSINKYSICATPSGLYFMDSVGKHLQGITSQGVSDISLQRYMTIWTKEQRSELWKPNDYTTKLFYDKSSLDLYVVTGDTSLCYNEGISQFVSFYDYGNVPVMFNIVDKFYCVKDGNIYRMFGGDYNSFFGEDKPYSVQFVSNGFSEGLTGYDKIFTNLDFRADRWNGEVASTPTDRSPFNYVEVSNEYQDTGTKVLDWNTVKPSLLKRKFRIWKVTIPRDKTHKMDRIRSPWSLVTLGYDPSKESNNAFKNDSIEFHDVAVQFYI